MQKYPSLKGTYLGNAISNFKKYISNELDIDFKTFILGHSKEFIFSEFDKFMNDKYGNI